MINNKNICKEKILPDGLNYSHLLIFFFCINIHILADIRTIFNNNPSNVVIKPLWQRYDMIWTYDMTWYEHI